MEEEIEIWELKRRLQAFVRDFRVCDDGKPAYCEFHFGIVAARPTEVKLSVTSRFDTPDG